MAKEDQWEDDWYRDERYHEWDKRNTWIQGCPDGKGYNDGSG